MKPSVILWDWDNTLMDTRPAASAAVRKLTSETGKIVTEDDITEIIGGHLTNFWYKNYGPEPLPAVRQFIEYYKEFSQNSHPFPETESVLSWGIEQGIPQMVVSNKNQEILDAEAARFGLSSYFQKIVGTVNYGIAKPERAFADIVFGSVWPENIIMVGDGESDMLFAKTLGAFGILIRSGTGKVSFPYNQRVASLADVLPVLKQYISS